MKKIIFIALCFLATNLKAQSLNAVLSNGNSASGDDIINVGTLKTDSLTNNSGGSLFIKTNAVKPLNVQSSKNLTLQSLSGSININTNGQAGILLSGRIGIGQGCNYSATSPVNCIDYPVYLNQADALNHSAENGDHYLVLDADSSYTLKVVKQ
jgi:hypothetical protein